MRSLSRTLDFLVETIYGFGQVELGRFSFSHGISDFSRRLSFLLLEITKQDFSLTGRAELAVLRGIAIEKTLMPQASPARAIARYLVKGILDGGGQLIADKRGMVFTIRFGIERGR